MTLRTSPLIPQAYVSAPMPGTYAQALGSFGYDKGLGTGTYGTDADFLKTGANLTQLPLTGNPVEAPLSLTNMPAVGPAAPSKGMFGGMFDNMLGTTDANGLKTDGWGGMALGAASGLLNTYMGMKQYGLAKDTLAEGKRQYDANYAAQKTTTNAQLEDRQRARQASNSGAYESVGSYMNKNGIK